MEASPQNQDFSTQIRDTRELDVQARPVPSSHAELVEYFLSTEAGEMQFETARMRPQITDEFYDYLSKQISAILILPILSGHVALLSLY